MALSKLKDFDPNHREVLDGNDIHGLSLYTDETDEKVGYVDDLLVDEKGDFRYLIVDLGFWIFGKKVLLPIDCSRINFQEQRVYALGMTKRQADDLPEYNEGMAVDYDYEEWVRGYYRSPATQSLEYATLLDTPAPMMNSPYSTTEPGVSTPDTIADPTAYGSMVNPTASTGVPALMDTPYSASEPPAPTDTPHTTAEPEVSQPSADDD